MPLPRPRGITIIALLLAWMGVSLVFLALARPVRAWAGAYWEVYLAAAVLHGASAWVAAFALWEQRSWARIAYGNWTVFAVGSALLHLLVPHDRPALSGLLPVILLVGALVPLTLYIRRSTRPRA